MTTREWAEKTYEMVQEQLLCGGDEEAIQIIEGEIIAAYERCAEIVLDGLSEEDGACNCCAACACRAKAKKISEL